MILPSIFFFFTVTQMKILVLFFVILIFLMFYCFFKSKKEHIYGIMITGKDTERINLARLSVTNFLEQKCNNSLHLIIINHHPHLKVMQYHHPNVIEIKLVKNDITLGEMRNIALSFIKKGELWTTWDDDDYRPIDYIKTLYDIMIKQNVSAVTFTDRYDFNANNNFIWRTHLSAGFVTILARKNNFSYLNLNSMEDVKIREAYPDLYIYDNKDKLMYLRLVHKNNTSIYVDPTKKDIKVTNTEDYKEYHVNEREKEMILSVINLYYNFGCK